MHPDISAILREWPSDPGNTTRKIRGLDGREKVQIRIRAGSHDGIVQFDCDGRPDGARPHGREFALDHFERKAAEEESAGGGFTLGEEEAQELFAEATMIYERYVVLFSLGDFDRVIADTQRNMRLFRFVHRHAGREEDREHLEKWWPYILRIQGLARIEKEVAARDFGAAFGLLRETRRAIESLDDRGDEVFREERRRSLKALAGLEKRLVRESPQDLAERLEFEKGEAVRRQDYERAAALRDRLRALREKQPPDA